MHNQLYRINKFSFFRGHIQIPYITKLLIIQIRNYDTIMEQCLMNKTKDER